MYDESPGLKVLLDRWSAFPVASASASSTCSTTSGLRSTLTLLGSSWALLLRIARGPVRDTETIQIKGIVFMKTLSNQPQEWKLVSLRECPTPEDMQICGGPEQAAKYWEAHVTSHPLSRARAESLVLKCPAIALREAIIDGPAGKEPSPEPMNFRDGSTLVKSIPYS